MPNFTRICWLKLTFQSINNLSLIAQAFWFLKRPKKNQTKTSKVTIILNFEIQSSLIHLKESHYLKYRSISIIVNSNNDFGISHPCQVLNSSRYTKSHIEFRSNNLSSLPYLHIKFPAGNVDMRTLY